MKSQSVAFGISRPTWTPTAGSPQGGEAANRGLDSGCHDQSPRPGTRQPVAGFPRTPRTLPRLCHARGPQPQRTRPALRAHYLVHRYLAAASRAHQSTVAVLLHRPRLRAGRHRNTSPHRSQHPYVPSRWRHAARLMPGRFPPHDGSKRPSANFSVRIHAYCAYCAYYKPCVG